MQRHLLAILFAFGLVLMFQPAQAQDPLAPEGIAGEVVYIPFPVEISLDGALDDWANVPAVTVTTGPRLSADPAENGAFTFAGAAKDDTLYITMTMPDQNIIGGQHGTDFWNEDSFEFYLNFSGDLLARTYSDAIYQININAADLGNSDPAAITVTGVNSAKIPVSAFVFPTDDGWGFEAAITLPEFVTLAHGLEIGFQAQINGASTENRDIKLIWSSLDTGDSSWQNPSVFGRGIFFEVGQTDIPQPSQVTAEDLRFDFESVDWASLVNATWEGYKQNYIFCGANCGDDLGLVFDPNMGYQAVSEGVGYGMLMAVMLDDQPTFDTIYDAAHAVMLDTNTGLFHWRADNQGVITGETSATDAEEDIAIALIFAEKLVERGQWRQHSELPYGDRARDLLDAVYLYEVADGRYLTPGDGWAGDGQEILNLSYFMPAWYRIFDDFEGGERWAEVLRYGYRALYATDGQALGLAPDWSQFDGDPAFPYCEATNRALDACKYDMTYDAIRVPWRIGLDCLWFGDARACEWSRRSAAFQSTAPASAFASMYTMGGEPVISYQDELTTGMWLVAALAAEDTDLIARLAEAFYGYSGNALEGGYWGGSTHYYFNQSLAWFGASLLSGQFQNLYED